MVKQSDVVFVAVKPGVVSTVLQDVKSIASGKLFISVAMGVTILEMEKVISLQFRLKYNLLLIDLFGRYCQQTHE